jgi:hypothetical protein
MKPFAAVALAALSITGAATAETCFTTIYSFAGGFPTGLIISGGTIYGAADQGACGIFPNAPNVPRWRLDLRNRPLRPAGRGA